MKRNEPMKRYTRLSPAPLSKRSKKRRNEIRDSADDQRREWASEFTTCAVCGGTYMLQTHEIASRGQTSNNECMHEASYLRACARCHDDHFSWLPENVQCAIKAIVDPERSDPAMICKLRHRAPTAITSGEVEAWKKFLLSWRGR